MGAGLELQSGSEKKVGVVQLDNVVQARLCMHASSCNALPGLSGLN